MRTVTEKILEILQAGAESTVDLIDIFASDRSTSYKKARRSMRYGPPSFKTDWTDWYRKRQMFYSLLNKLKREGFIIQKEKRKNTPWFITRSGGRRLTQIKKRGQQRSVAPQPKYQSTGNGSRIIIAFDVPERERGKRRWLRAALISLGFQKLQQSVWAGDAQLPSEFIQDMKEYDVLPYVHIFSVTGGGTLHKMY